MHYRIFKSSVLSFLLLMIIMGCEADIVDPDAICEGTGSNEKCFSIPMFASNLEGNLQQTTLGYSYAIYYLENLKAWGDEGSSTRTQDGGPYSISAITSSMNLGSTAKSITTIATLQLLEARGLTINTKIIDYLPDWWVFGDNIDQITFRDLLRHESGFRPSSQGVTYNQIKSEIRMGVSLSDYGVNQYQNMNFCILRIIIPILNNDFNPTFSPIDGGPSDSENDILTTNAFLNYIRNNIVSPVGVSDFNCNNEDDIYYYNYFVPGGNGWKPENECPNAGGGTLSMPVSNLAAIMARTFHSNKTLSESMKALMFNESLPLGCYSNQTDGAQNWGTQFHHNGGFDDSQGRGGVACWYIFHNDVVCAVSTNSAGGIPNDSRFQDINDLIEVSYDAAWY